MKILKHLLLPVMVIAALAALPVYAADDVALLHGNSLPVVDSTGRTWTNSGATLDTVNKVFGAAALSFNGSAYLSSPDNADSHFGDGRPVAMDFWVRLTQFPANQDKYVVYSQGSSISNFVLVELYNDNGNMGIVIEGANGGHYPAYASLTSFDVGEWHHLAIQKESGNTYRMYQNCQALSVTGVFNIPYTNWTSPVYIGQFINGGARLRGQLDEFYLTRTVRFSGSSCTLPTGEYVSPSVTATPAFTPTVTTTPLPTSTSTLTPTVTASPVPSATSTPTPFVWTCTFPLVAVSVPIDPQHIALTCE